MADIRKWPKWAAVIQIRFRGDSEKMSFLTPFSYILPSASLLRPHLILPLQPFSLPILFPLSLEAYNSLDPNKSSFEPCLAQLPRHLSLQLPQRGVFASAVSTQRNSLSKSWLLWPLLSPPRPHCVPDWGADTPLLGISRNPSTVVARLVA